MALGSYRDRSCQAEERRRPWWQAPDGAATLKLLTIAPRALAGTTWEREKERFASALVKMTAARMDFEPSETLAVVAECPACANFRKSALPQILRI